MQVAALSFGHCRADHSRLWDSAVGSDDETRRWLFPNKKDGKYLAGDSRGWKLVEARNKIAKNDHKTIIRDIDYRPFDIRKIYYSTDMVDWGRQKYMHHFLAGENIGLMICRQTAIDGWEHISITKTIADDSRVSNRSKERGYILPLYLYPENNGQQSIEKTEKRKPNLNQEILNQFTKNLDLIFTSEKEETKNTFAPIDILDYIYAVLHSPNYRKKYKGFLKIDFPKVPYPKDKKTFYKLVELGGEIREIHLMESSKLEEYTTSYPKDGDNKITRKLSKTNIGYDFMTLFKESFPFFFLLQNMYTAHNYVYEFDIYELLYLFFFIKKNTKVI